MIFNPLFMQDGLPNKMGGIKQEKLAGNKYLFADIVKVIMNPDGNNNDTTVSSEKTEGTDITSLFTLGVKFKKLKEKILSELEGKEDITNLIDILPPEIAQLLLNTENIENNEAVSYLSNEPLKGELKEFLYNLLGEDFINKNISTKSGLLLKLEDKKSTVNVELVQEPQKENGESKIMVQTLVVPEKSKLNSLINSELKNQNIKVFPKSNAASNLTESAKEVNKPTLSLYSFNPESENKTKQNITSAENAQSNSANANEKIKELSVITSKVFFGKMKSVEKKNESSENVKDLKVKYESKPAENVKGKTQLKVINPSAEKKDFMINKITILKKETPQKGLENQIKEKNISTALKKIDFEKKLTKTDSAIKSIENSNTKNISEETEKIKVNTSTEKVASKDMLVSEAKVEKNNVQVENKVSENIVLTKTDDEKENIQVKVSNRKQPEILKTKNKDKLKTELKNVNIGSNKITSENVTVPKTENNRQEIQAPNEDNKTSLRVKTENKTEVKTEEGNKFTDVSDTKNETGSNAKNDSETNQNSNSKNNYLHNLQTGKQNIPEAKFHHTLTREEKIATGFINDNTVEDVQKERSEKLVKSFELVKEVTKFISKQDKGVLTLKIQPEHLGKMKITLDSEDETLKAKIEVDTQQAKQIIEKNIDKLQQDLNQNGIKLGSLNISLGNSKERNDGETFNENASEFTEGNEFDTMQENEELKDSKSMGYNTYEYIA
ncbi:MAG: hypothetical protein CR986_01530 [Ignavibacteriae bacterium]|nr:MAG: hypothetical protein CR986_01530 [Ignavibacteriota bacterium]